MSGYIHRIKTKIPYSSREIDIDVQGKNLIFTGGNGCGKTQLLNHLYQKLTQRIVHRNNYDEQQLIGNISTYESRLKTTSKAHPNYQHFKSIMQKSREQLEETRNPPVFINDIEQFVIRYHEQKALLLKFDALRQANIKESKAAASKDDLIKQEFNLKKQQITTAAPLFEEYLVSHKTTQAYAESPSIDNSPEEANKIKDWFDKLQGDLKELFEDKSLELIFDSKVQAFFIRQENKEPYRLQQLPSGYSSILSVYADLLTRVELRSIAPDDIDGVVLIDEIDAHLHITLQKKIFHFLDKAFPKIQFIVTTHSPFVVSSVKDVVIYDLSRLEQVDDLSMYSYESIIEGLFDVLPISDILEDAITKMNELTNADNPDMEELGNLVAKVGQYESKLDGESAYFLKMARIVISKARSKGM